MHSGLVEWLAFQAKLMAKLQMANGVIAAFANNNAPKKHKLVLAEESSESSAEESAESAAEEQAAEESAAEESAESSAEEQADAPPPRARKRVRQHYCSKCKDFLPASDFAAYSDGRCLRHALRIRGAGKKM